MRLVTYDRGGARRLGALVDGAVVDLPEAVGHPAFPITLEELVRRNGGTTLEAARHALARPGVVEGCGVIGARLLAPYVPPQASETLLGPEDRVPWPLTETYLDHNPQLACIVGRGGRDATQKRAGSMILGYTLMITWLTARRRRKVGLSFGPCAVTADAFHPEGGRLVSRVDGEVVAEVPLAPATWIFREMVAARSMTQRGVRPGSVFASPLTRRSAVGVPLEPGSVVEVEADGIGVLRHELGLAAARATAL